MSVAYRFTDPQIYPSIHPSICPSAHLPVCPSARQVQMGRPIDLLTFPHLPICPSARLPIYLQTSACVQTPVSRAGACFFRPDPGGVPQPPFFFGTAMMSSCLQWCLRPTSNAACPQDGKLWLMWVLLVSSLLSSSSSSVVVVVVVVVVVGS